MEKDFLPNKREVFLFANGTTHGEKEGRAGFGRRGDPLLIELTPENHRLLPEHRAWRGPGGTGSSEEPTLPAKELLVVETGHEWQRRAYEPRVLSAKMGDNHNDSRKPP